MKTSFIHAGGTRLVIAALSARALSAQAAAEGFAPIAFDVFGDADTRASGSWRGIGAAHRLAIDAGLLHAALRACARDAACPGWIAGSGFEMQLDLLESAAGVLPLIGNTPDVVRRARDPGIFYPLLADLGVPHPETRVSPPRDCGGWLLKNARACGGWHVRPAPAVLRGPLSCGAYFQREARGTPMSALFLADGRCARVLGIAEQRIRPLGRRRWVFHGGVGPARVSARVSAQIADFAERISAALGLVGLNGIDFMLDGEAPSLIELNARPTAAISLFADALPAGLVHAHLASWQGARVSEFAVEDTSPRGFEVLFAQTAGRVDATLHAALLCTGWCADVPMPGTPFEPGDPLCTVLATGSSIPAVERCLEARIATVRDWMAASCAAHRAGEPVDSALARGDLRGGCDVV